MNLRHKCISRYMGGWVLILTIVVALVFPPTASAQTVLSQDQRMEWWRDAHFGLFIHWGIYSIPGGVWKGKEYSNIGEHIMRNARIPAVEYRKLAAKFNPQDFNAKTYVDLAKRAGMKYIAITAKHHDGFAMFKSYASPYNVVDATPFKRDIVKELADECHRQGIKFCFYYSQSRDWNEPNGLHNDWDFHGKRYFQKYLEEKVKPQLTELLTNYGPVGMIWFDTPENISHEQASELKALVRKLQPECIISGRLGGGVETDYQSTKDNVIPSFTFQGDWETPATLNNTWGYKANDRAWKSPADLTRILFDICSKGGNYLLNIGPDAEGRIPQRSVEILEKIGDWLAVNGEAIYGTRPSPFKTEFAWGGITTKPGKLYLGIFDWREGDFYLEGLRNRVKRVYLLSDPSKRAIPFEETYAKRTDHHRIRLDLPANAPDEAVSVVVIEISGGVETEQKIVQQTDGRVSLPGILARTSKGEERVQLDYSTSGGGAIDYTDREVTLTWDFEIERPGKYQVNVITAQAGGHQRPIWHGGQTIRLSSNGQELVFKMAADRQESNPRTQYWDKIYTDGGEFTFLEAGKYTISLIPIDFSNSEGAFTFREVELSLTD